VEYGKAKAVARLIINGSGGCTGWLVGPNNVLLTNEHCISSNSDAQNTDYQFMYEGASCGSNSVSGVSTFDGLNLLKDNYAKDYALVQLSGNPVDTFG
jgi:V8-like Glu-specific endopeptidase